jgi:predicted AAA+ superfamily ATPase
MIERPTYVSWLKKAKDTEFIKVITGVRRSGKSMILEMARRMIEEAGSQNILQMNFESQAFLTIKKGEDLAAFIQSAEFDRHQKVYFLFDEIQEVEGWQKVINSLRVDYDADIYITGSNAKLLSGELATYLSGRYVELKVFPLSFKEYLSFIDFDARSKSPDVVFNDYVTWGGFPMLPGLADDQIKQSVSEGIFDSILLKDVALRGEVRDRELLLRVVDFLLDNIGKPLSSTNIANSLKNYNVKTTNSSVDRYLNLLRDALLFYRAQRYDIRGKERLKTLGKYYVVDTGLRNQQLGKTFRDNRGNQLENIVFVELQRRGYQVFVGKYDTKEIDFVALKAGRYEYFQVTYQLPENSTREEDNLLKLPDNYRKTIITASRMDVGNIGGIDVVHIVDWLLQGDGWD